MPTTDLRGLGKGAGEQAALDAWPAGKVCPDCLNAGHVRRDVMPDHPEFGKSLPCPACDGKSIVRRNDPAVVRFMLRREHAAQTVAAQSFEVREKPTPPPEGFSKADGKVPLMGKDHLRDAQRRQIAANVAAVAAKLKGGAA